MVGIIPAAGRGTRMASVTGGLPKELLRLGGETVLGRVVAEAREAGADRVVVVSSQGKPEIDAAVAAMGADVEIAYQASPLGVGDAVASAQVDDDALILMGDAVYHGGSPCTRMANLIHRGIDGCIAVEEVDDAHVSLYGIVEIDEGTGGIRRILEKPKPEATRSRWAVSARYALSRAMMSHLAAYSANPPERDAKGEVNLTQILMRAILDGADLRAVAVQPGQMRVDCGSPEEYAQARRLEWQ